MEYVKHQGVENATVGQVVPIAGDYHMKTGVPLESEVFRLKDSGSNTDSAKEGVRVELSGGRQPLEKNGQKQKAIIEFLCDPSRDGKDTEVDDRPETDDGDDKGGDDKDGKSALLRRDEEKPKDRALTFISYKDEVVNKEDWGVLRLEWKTKYACENAVNEPSSPSSGHWGFFTWLIIV